MKSMIASVSAAVALVACGGGGGVPSLHEGLYMASSINLIGVTGRPSSVLVLENQEAWILEGFNPPIAFGHGTFTFTGTGAYPDGTAFAGTSYSIFSQSKTLSSVNSNVLGEIPAEIRLSSDGSYLAVSSPNIQGGGPSGTLVTTATGFDYSKPASLADVSGTWRGITIDSTGAIAGTNLQETCTLAGTLTPRPSGKNVFNLSLALTGCPDAGGYSGIAFTYMDAAGFAGAAPYTVPSFRLMAISTDKAKMFSLTATK